MGLHYPVTTDEVPVIEREYMNAGVIEIGCFPRSCAHENAIPGEPNGL
jgi:hypothetical protein